jgi:hypothetical protein
MFGKRLLATGSPIPLDCLRYRYADNTDEFSEVVRPKLALTSTAKLGGMILMRATRVSRSVLD